MYCICLSHSVQYIHNDLTHVFARRFLSPSSDYLVRNVL